MAPWLNWIEQPPPKGQVAGSNPAGVTIFSAQLIEIPSSLIIEGDRRVTHSVHIMPFRHLLL